MNNMELLGNAHLDLVEIAKYYVGTKEYNTGTTVSVKYGIFVEVYPILTSIETYSNETIKDYLKERLKFPINILLYDLEDINTNNPINDLFINKIIKEMKKLHPVGSVIKLENNYTITLEVRTKYKQNVEGNRDTYIKRIIPTKAINDIRERIIGRRRSKKIL